jgi:uncharacterized membrane-anchored protein YitT (DUF2179 family)
MYYKKILKYVKEYVYLVVGAFILAFSTANILLPNQLSTGGFSGIATIFYYLFKFPMGATIVILNIPLCLIAFFKINKKLFVKSIIGMFLLSFFIDKLELLGSITEDRFLACVYGGIIAGIGTAIILKAGASTGGTDLLSYVIRAFNNKYRSSRVILIADTVIIIMNVVFFKEIEIGLYSVIAIYLMGKLIDIVFEGFYFTKIIFIISDYHNEIAKVVGEKVKRGSTGIYSRGMYSKNEKVMLFCVASRKEISEIKSIVKSIDKNAFIVTTDAMETLGNGFSE